MIPSYGKVIALAKGGRYTQGLFDVPLVVQEKIDGSQVSFALEPIASHDVRGYTPIVRSKNSVVEPGNKQFSMVREWAGENVEALNLDYVYRGEAVTSKRHNTLTYSRIPHGGVILYDIYDRRNNRMLDPDEVRDEAERIGLEVVPTLYRTFTGGYITSAALVESLKLESCLGGCKVEGVVAKAYSLPDPTSTDIDSANCFLKVKVVSPEFKEVHGASWKQRNPNGADTVANLVTMYGTEARAAKAVQHLRDEGLLADDVSDIGKLMGEMQRDITEECKEEILEALWKQYGKRIVQGAAKMMPNYYKEKVLELV